jgi:hypothetical protein
VTHSRLACGRCGGRVADGRCPSCRSSREAFQAVADSAAGWLLALAFALLLVLALSARAALP